jgi:hypothetical protein
MFTDVLPMVTDVYPMVTDVYPMVAEESSVANPQKVAKIDENIRKMQKKMGWQHCICGGITRFLGIIGSHRWHQ